MNIETVGFVGLGLIGGSIAKAIKEFHPEIQIMAYMRSTDTLIEAANEGKVADFFLRYRKLDENDRNALFISEVKKAAEKIIYKLKELQMNL